jgi:hypothetical protein
VLRGGHLVHKIGMDRLILLRLRVQQLRIEGGSKVRWERLVLIQVVALEEAVEVGVVWVRNVKRVGRDVGALGAEMRRVVLRQVLGL